MYFVQPKQKPSKSPLKKCNLSSEQKEIALSKTSAHLTLGVKPDSEPGAFPAKKKKTQTSEESNNSNLECYMREHATNDHLRRHRGGGGGGHGSRRQWPS